VELKTFGSGSAVWNYDVGDRVTMTGTVSKHEEFKGTKSTMVKRASFA
jgi:hypothetical protein